jgi:hypothetical protein
MECRPLRGLQNVVFTRNIECGYDIRTVWELPGDKDVKTIYTHVLNRGPSAVLTPADDDLQFVILSPRVCFSQLV